MALEQINITAMESLINQMETMKSDAEGYKTDLKQLLADAESHSTEHGKMKRYGFVAGWFLREDWLYG
jgi:hypothetical protein